MRSYSEVLSRIQALPPKDKADFIKFQEHLRSFLPQILQGETPKLSVTQQTGVTGSKDSSTNKDKNQEKTWEARTSE
jgi:hypothetical protein